MSTMPPIAWRTPSMSVILFPRNQTQTSPPSTSEHSPMKAFKKVVLVVLLIPVVVLIGSLFLPSKYRVERSLEMRTKPDAIFAQVSGLKNWTNWTAWTVAKYPDMQVSFSGPESGAGATYTWDGKSTGHGMLKL